MKKILTVTIIFLLSAALLTQIASVYFSNTQALDSISATSIKSEIGKLSQENMTLSAKVLAFSSYGTIASRAAELGFEKNRDIVSVYDPIQVALKR